MQFLIEKQTRRVLLGFDDGVALSLVDTLVAPNMVVSDVSSETHEIESASPPVAPLYFVPGALAYDGDWSVLDQDTYNALVDGAVVEAGRQLEIAKSNKSAAVGILRDQKLTGGFSYDFGAPGVHVLQTRDADDKVNWLTSQAAYSAAVAAGAGAAPGATFRSADNVSFTVSYAEGLTALLAMAAWGASIYGRSWALKDEIAAAADAEALAAIDIEAGWPA